MAGGREYTRAGLIRNPLLWILFLVLLYFFFFSNVLLVPLGHGAPQTALIQITLKGPHDARYTDLERFMGDRSVYYQGELVNRLLPGESFKVLFLASLLSFYPTDTVLLSDNLPMQHSSMRIELHLGLFTRTFATEGFDYISQLRGHGAIGMVSTMEEHLFQPQEGSARASGSSAPSR